MASPTRAYWERLRQDAATRSLEATLLPIKEIGYRLGFQTDLALHEVVSPASDNHAKRLPGGSEAKAREYRDIVSRRRAGVFAGSRKVDN